MHYITQARALNVSSSQVLYRSVKWSVVENSLIGFFDCVCVSPNDCPELCFGAVVDDFRNL